MKYVNMADFHANAAFGRAGLPADCAAIPSLRPGATRCLLRSGLCPDGERDHHPATLAAPVRLTLASWSRGFPPGHASSSAASSKESRAFLLIRGHLAGYRSNGYRI